MLLCEGLAYKEVAARLGVGVSTVGSHAANAYVRLGVRGRGGRRPAIGRMMSAGWHLEAPVRGRARPLTPIQRAYVECWDRFAAHRTGRDEALVEVASILLLGEHRLAPDRPVARPDIDTLLLRMAVALQRTIP